MISAEEEETRGSASTVRYLIARREGTRLEVLTLCAQAGGEALPVFETEGTALAFLRSGGLGGGWRVRESTAGELVSLLMGHLPRVELVVLDPALGVVAEDAEQLSASKKEFVEALMGDPLAAYAR
jgi:hypothetical protein